MSIKCMLIEDDVDDHEIFKAALKETNPVIQCDYIFDTSVWFEALQNGTLAIPDVIFLDVNMPKLDDVDVLAALKQLEKLKQTRIVMISTSKNPKVIELCNLIGVEEYIVTPARLIEFVEILRRILVSK